MADPKKILREYIANQKRKKSEEELERKRKNDEDRNSVLQGVGGDLANTLGPALVQVLEQGKVTQDMIRDAFAEAIQISMPEVQVPEIDVSRFAEIAERIEKAVAKMNLKEPIVNVPAPVVHFPENKLTFPDRFKVSMDEVDNMRPLPVQMVDLKGRPMSFPIGASGGKGDFFTVKGIRDTVGVVTINPDGSPVYGGGSALGTVSISDIFGTVGADVVNPDGRIKVELPTGASGLTDTELRAAHLDVDQLSGSSWSTVVNEIFGSTATGVINPDNRIKVELPSGSSGLTDTELRAAHLDVDQLSGSSWSTSVVSISDIFSTTSTSNVVNPDNRVKVELPSGSSGLTDTELRAAHLDVQQVSGTIDSVNVVSTVGLTDTELRAAHLDVEQVSGSTWSTSISGQTATLDVRQVSGASNSVNILAGTITAVTTVTSITNSVATVGNVASDVADNGDGPIKIGGIARTANPTAVAAGDRVSFTSDDLGRQVTRNVQVRDLIQTAYVSVTNGTETTLRAGVAGAFLDCIMITGSNNSDAAVSVDIRAVTAGNIIHTMRIPANGMTGWAPSVPWPQDATGNNWTVDGPDETGRTLTFSALFSQEI